MTATMTSRQRLECAMRGGEPDRMACGPYGLGHISLDTPIGQELLASTDLMVDVSIRGDPILGVSAEVLTTQEGDTVTFAIPTPKGPLVRRVRQTAVTSATVEFPFKTPEDVEKLLSLPYTAPEPDVSAYRAMEERVGEEGLVMGGVCTAVCLAASWFSPEGFCLAWADAPEQVMRLTALAAERINAWVEKACRAGVRAFRLIGGEYVTVQLGPRAVPDLLTRFDTALVDVIHRHGALAHYHNHGPLMRFLPELAELGIDSVDPLEAPPWGDVHLAEARRAAGDRLCLVGNLDDMEVVEALPAEEVVAIARERALAAGPRAFVLSGTASGTYTERGARNFIAMAEMARNV